MKSKIRVRKPNVLTAVMHRNEKWRPTGPRRRYTTLKRAICGCTGWIVEHGYVGDVVELYDVESGLAVGTVKMTSSGGVKSDWIWEEKGEAK